MPLVFPTNPSSSQTYQSGSSATYIWNGFYWDIETAPTATVITAASASVAFSATSASFASTGSSVNTLNQSVVVSGSFTVFTGSAVEFQVHDVGVKLGSLQTDRHQITGSLNVTGSITGSLFGTASVLPTPATSIMAFNTSALSFPTLTSTDITGWTNIVAENASQWNPSTGVFTSSRPGSYIIACSVQFTSMTLGSVGSELSIFSLGGVGVDGGGVARFFNQVTGIGIFPPSLHFTCLVRFTGAGQTLKIQVFNSQGTTATNNSNGTSLMIQEVSRTISL